MEEIGINLTIRQNTTVLGGRDKKRERETLTCCCAEKKKNKKTGKNETATQHFHIQFDTTALLIVNVDFDDYWLGLYIFWATKWRRKTVTLRNQLIIVHSSAVSLHEGRSINKLQNAPIHLFLK